MSTAVQDLERAQWLRDRRKLIGASEVAAILGVDPHRGPLAVYASKLDLARVDETPAMRWGRKAEALVAEAYGEESGRPVLMPAARIIQHPDIPFLGASLDRVTGGCEKHPAPVVFDGPCGRDDCASVGAHSHPAPLECKVVGFHNAASWKEEPPIEYVVQVQFQMACTGAQWASLAAMFGWPPRPAWVDLERNDAFINAALPKLEEFWRRVERADPPPPDTLPQTSEVIRKLWPADSGATIHLDGEALALVERWEAARERRLADKKDSDEEDLANQIRFLMRDATTGMLPDGTSLTLKTTKRAGYTVEPTTYRTLRRFTPKGRR
jgi:putative phage-type endonuclease